MERAAISEDSMRSQSHARYMHGTPGPLGNIQKQARQDKLKSVRDLEVENQIDITRMYTPLTNPQTDKVDGRYGGINYAIAPFNPSPASASLMFITSHGTNPGDSWKSARG